MALLAAETFDFSDSDALHANTGKCFAHFVQLERFDDGCDEFHFRFFSRVNVGAADRACQFG